MKKRSLFVGVVLLITAMLCIIIYNNEGELNSIKSYKQLEKYYENNVYKELSFGKRLLTLPFSIGFSSGTLYEDVRYDTITNSVDDAETTGTIKNDTDYSKTNTQVEGVDEADIVKTDGKYTYSISNQNVIITNVMDPSNIKIESKINAGGIPNDLVLYKDLLIIISVNDNATYSNKNTIVNIYDIKNKSLPKKKKSFELLEAYNTTRCIDNKLYVISSGSLRKDGDKVETSYIENNIEKELTLNKIKYLKDVRTRNQTLIAGVDLDNLDKDINLNSYLINMSNAYVSTKNIYITNSNYNYNNNDYEIYKIFGIKGIFGLFDDYDNYTYKKETQIYKFNITSDGIKYNAKGKVDGSVINQYSFDEKDNHLRIGLETNEGSKIVVLNEYLNIIGKTSPLAKGERMYATRFMGDKAYLVTYKNTDPLFVVDLKDETNPKVLGQLHIPGYSSYLHPYDETHLIGIGMESEETVNRDDEGRVISTSAVITGMKMSLFDVSDVTNPIEVDKTVIGDSRTISSVLSNPKALLFSKEKELIAIPVNNYDEDFTIDSEENIDDELDSFIEKSKNRTSEGYFVYNINLEEGFKLKGTITHEGSNYDEENYWRNNSKLLRGLYIKNSLITLSENEIKVNDLNNLELLSELSLK